MRIVILYHPESDHSRTVEEYTHDFMRRNPEVKMESLSVDTLIGARTAELYDIMQYPSMIALRDDNSMAKSWVGLPLPLMNEVAYFSFT
jgi:hypothetical protein